MRKKTTLITVTGVSLAVLATVTITAFASQSAMPGDMLYGVKRSFESLGQNLAFSQSAKDDVAVNLLGNRITEFKKISTDNIHNVEDINEALDEVNHQKDEALTELGDTKENELDKKTETKLGEYIKELNEYLKELKKKLIEANKDGNTARVEILQSKIDKTEQQLVNPTLPPKKVENDEDNNQGDERNENEVKPTRTPRATRAPEPTEVKRTETPEKNKTGNN